jgi:microcystin-dependent protein
MPRIAGIDKSGASIGAILPHGAGAAPAGFLLCDGTAYSRTTYARLFAAIGTTYGAGDGSTTFNVPNGQGVFLRGAGSQTIGGVSYSGTLGATQADAIQNHSHSVVPFQAGAENNGKFVNGNDTGSPSFGTIFSGGAAAYAGNPVREDAETRPANISANYMIAYI